MECQSYLKDDYEILGIIDFEYDYDYLQQCNYIQIEQIKNMEFEYIIILDKDATSRRKVIDILIKEGVDDSKIIIPWLLFKQDTGFIPDLSNEASNCKSIKTVILGLSYSLRGTDQNTINTKCYDCSWHGLDLYYNYLS